MCIRDSPKNYPNKELAGKPVVFKIKLHDVCVRQLPALNSDFAKKMGKETMEEYRAFVKQQLFDGRHGGALNHAKDMILGQLADATEGEIPSILVETPTSSRCRSSSSSCRCSA